MTSPVSPTPVRVDVIIPVHNRRLTTLACLRRLHAQGVLAWAQALIVDDGSSDGTSEAVRAEFPTVEILRGDGTLFWTGAIELGMKHAQAHGADFIFWLNDDCETQPGALETLRAVAQARGAVTGGMCLLPRTGQPVYSGFRKMRDDLERVNAVPGEVVACDALNGNLVCFPRAIVAAVGWPDGRGLPHGMGDVDYTLRVRAGGFPVLLVGAAQAHATPHNRRGYASWLLSGMGVREVWATLFDRRAYGYLPAEVRFRVRHWGLWGFGRAMWSLAKRVPVSLVILLVPLATRRRWWGARSAAWRYEEMIRAETGDE